jgi:hypothetical protein
MITASGFCSPRLPLLSDVNYGQLYVAFSRATSREGVKVQIKETDKQGHLLKNLPGATEEEKKKVFTKNIVYKEVLL